MKCFNFWKKFIQSHFTYRFSGSLNNLLKERKKEIYALFLVNISFKKKIAITTNTMFPMIQNESGISSNTVFGSKVVPPVIAAPSLFFTVTETLSVATLVVPENTEIDTS